MAKILLWGIAAILALIGCSKQLENRSEKAEQHKVVSGEITRLDTLVLTYRFEFGRFSRGHQIPITLLEVSGSNKTKHYLVLTGKSVIRERDVVTLDYVIDNMVTSEEIFLSLYGKSFQSSLIQEDPSFRYNGDGLVFSWRVESSQQSSEFRE